jgi:hypothetical protein
MFDLVTLINLMIFIDFLKWNYNFLSIFLIELHPPEFSSFSFSFMKLSWPLSIWKIVLLNLL